MSDSVRPHRRKPTRLPHPWDSPGKNTGVVQFSFSITHCGSLALYLVLKRCPGPEGLLRSSQLFSSIIHSIDRFRQGCTHPIELVMPSSHLILYHSRLLLPSIVPSIRANLCMRWPKYWSFSVSISPFKEHPGLISFRMDWLDLLAVQGTLKSLLQHHSIPEFSEAP